MDRKLALVLARLTYLPENLQETLWDLNDKEVTILLAASSGLTTEISEKIINNSDEETFKAWLSKRRSSKLINKIKKEKITPDNIMNLLIQEKIPKKLIEHCINIGSEKDLYRILQKYLEKTLQLSKEQHKKLIVKYSQMIPKTTESLGKKYSDVLGNDINIWKEILLNNPQNTGLLKAGIRYCRELDENVLLEIFTLVNNPTIPRTRHELKDIEFFNAQLVRNPYLSLDFIYKIKKLQEENKINYNSATYSLINERIKIDSADLLKKIENNTNSLTDLYIILENSQKDKGSSIDISDQIIMQVLENYDNLPSKYVEPYLRRLDHYKTEKIVKILEKQKQYNKIEIIAKERTSVIKMLDNPKPLLKSFCEKNMPILRKSINIESKYHSYIATFYRKISDIIEEPAYAAIIIDTIEKEKPEAKKYIYKLLPEWEDSLHNLIAIGNKLSN